MSPEVKLLDHAIELTKKHGLAKRAFHSQNGKCYCTVGFLIHSRNAIPDAKTSDYEAMKALGRVMETMRNVLSVLSLTMWNDEDERTLDEVREAFTATRSKFANRDAVAA